MTPTGKPTAPPVGKGRQVGKVAVADAAPEAPARKPGQKGRRQQSAPAQQVQRVQQVRQARQSATTERRPVTKGTVKGSVGSTTTKKGTTTRGAGRRRGGPYAGDEKFLADQRHGLLGERAVYESQATDLRAEAESLAQEREPGDVQFDEESGEGGTVTVDRERDLALSAQALAAVEEIDQALRRIDDGSYGVCERCGHPIPKPRLRALPFARLCVACKSGGLSSRR